MKMSVAPDHSDRRPSPFAALSSSLSDVVPTQTTRLPRALAALMAAAVAS
jgi:hypothetical protein